MSKKVALYLLPPLCLVAIFLGIDLLTNHHNLWMSGVVTLGWWLFSFGSDFLSKNRQKFLFFLCVAIIVSIISALIYIKQTV